MMISSLYKHLVTQKIQFIIFLAILLMFGNKPINAQGWFTIDQLKITGNNRTKQAVIEKELDFGAGDTIQLEGMLLRFNENKNRLLNTGLFNYVEINISEWLPEEKRANITVVLIENWFWYPVPIFELADRSFNEWYYQHNAELNRLNLGIRFMHINLSGNNDMLKLNFHGGFITKYELDYTFPNLINSKNLGAYVNVLYVKHKEIPFETRENRLNFFRLEKETLLTRFRSSIGINHRRNKSIYQALHLEYHHKIVHDTIAKYLNPYYFNAYESSIDHFSLNYHLLFTKVDKKIYPTSGYRYLADIRKDGLGIFDDMDQLHFMGAWEQHFQIANNYSIGGRIKAKKTLSFNKEIPYSYLPALGYYDDVLSGYQLYVIDGADFVYFKSFQKIKLLDILWNLEPYMPLKQFKLLPLQFYVAIHADLAYVDEPRVQYANAFNNQLLYGGGLSLDLIVYENYLFSCEFTINHLGETGIFLKGTNTFE